MRKLIASNHVLISVIGIVFLATIWLLTSSVNRSSAESTKVGNQAAFEQESDSGDGSDQIYLPLVSNTGNEQNTPTPQPTENTTGNKVFLPVVSRNGSGVSTPTATPKPTTEPPIDENPGYVSGVVYNSTSCDKHLITCSGLSGASITLAKVDPAALAQVRAARKQQIVASGFAEPLAPLRDAGVTVPLTGTVLTRSDGSFDFPVNESGSYWLRVEKDGFTYAQREIELVVGHSTATNAIYLTPLDAKVTTCTATGCTHTNSDGSIQLVIPAGAVPAGQSVDVTATNFKQVEYLPSGELPEGTWETYAFNLGGDSEFAFQPGTTGTVRVKNDKGFNPGTRIPLGYWNQATQAWEHAGTGTVDASGQWVETGVAHFSNYDINLPIVEPNIDIDTGGDDGEGPSDEPDEPCNGEEGCFINRKSGTLQEWIDLPPVNVLGENIAPQLRYSTNRVQPSQVIDIDLRIQQNGSVDLGKYVGWELYIEGEKTDNFSFAADLSAEGQAGRYRYLWDGRNAQGELLPPGVYEYKIKLSFPYKGQYCYALNGIFGNPPDCVNGATGRFVDATIDKWVRGEVAIDTQLEGAFGAGWILEDWQQLYESNAGNLMVANGMQYDSFLFPAKPLLNGKQQPNALIAWTNPSQHAIQFISEALVQKSRSDIIPIASELTAFDVTKDGNWVYVASEYESLITIIDLNSHQTVDTISISDQPTNIVLSPDENFAYLITGISKSSITVVDLVARREVATIELIPGLADIVTSPDGKRVYAVSPSWKKFATVNLSDFSTISIRVGVYPTNISISQDGKYGYVSDNAAIEVVDLSSYEVLDSIPLMFNNKELVLSQDGKRAYVVNYSGLAVVDIEKRVIINWIPIDNLPLKIALSIDEKLAYVTNSQKSLLVIDLITGQVNDIYTPPSSTYGYLVDFSLSADQHYMYMRVDTDGNKLLKFDLSVQPQLHSLHEQYPRSIDISSDGHLGYVTNAYNEVSIQNFRTIESLGTMDIGFRPYDFSISYDNGIGYATNIDNGIFAIFDLKDRHPVTTTDIGARPTFITLSTDGRRAYVVHDTVRQGDSTISIIDLTSQSKIDTIPIDGHIIGNTVLSFDNRILFFIKINNSGEHILVLFDLNSFTTFKEISVYSWVEKIALSSDGRFLCGVGIGAFNDGLLMVMDLEQNLQVSVIDTLISTMDLATSPTRPFAYLASEFLGISVIDLSARQLVGTLFTSHTSNSSWEIASSNPITPIIIAQTNTDYSTLTYDLNSQTYTRVYPDGVKIHFNPNGTHDFTLDSDGRKTVYTYNANDSLATMGIVPPGGNSAKWLWTFNYTNGKLSSIKDPAGRITTIQIDAIGDLVQAILPDTSKVRFAYDNRHLLTKYTDQNDQVTDYTYDKYGRIATVTEPSRAVYNPTAGTTENKREVLTFTPSDTGYPLINDSSVGNPDAPAPAVPKSAQLIDRVVYGRGEISGHTNRWGSWLDETDGLGRITFYQRDIANNITHQTYPNGECKSFVYDNNGNTLSEITLSSTACTGGITAATVSASEALTRIYTYEARFNQIKTETDSLGRTTTYLYDYEAGLGDAGNLIRIYYPPIQDESGILITPTISYTYNSLGLLESETDLRGSITRYVYTQGSATESFGAANALFAQNVTPVPGLLTQVIEDYGDSTHFNLKTIYKEFDAIGNWQSMVDPHGNVTRATFDSLGRRLSETDALGRVTKYEYDGRGNLVKKIEDYTADGTTGRNIITTYSYDEGERLLSERTVADGLTREQKYSYDINGQLATQTDSMGNTTLYQYDAADQRIAEIDPLGAKTTYSYTLRGQLSTLIDPDSMVTRYRYDAFSRQSQQIVAAGQLSLTTSYEYDLEGNLVRMTAPDNVVTCYAYDSHNRRVSETRDCNGLKLTSVYTYNVAGDLIATHNQRGIVTRNGYDKLGRLISTTQDANGLKLTTTYRYDANGNLTSTTDPRGTVTTFGYNALNQRTSMMQDANGLKLPTSYGYDRLNHQNSITDPNGIVTRIDYNAFGLPVKQIDDANGLAAEIRYSYDNNLNLIAITDDNGNSTRYSYDKLNRSTQAQFADTTTVKLAYNLDGTLKTRTDQANVLVNHSYDAANRLLSKSYPDGSKQNFGYDAAGRMTNATQTMNGHTTQNSFIYNALGDVISSMQTVDSLSWGIGYSYNYGLGTATTHYPSGIAVNHALDRVGRLQSVQQDNALVATYRYTDTSGAMALTHANGVVSLFESDPLYRVTRIHTGKANQTPFADYRYGYDKAGNRTYMQRGHKPNAPADVYQYDGLYQLTKVWYGANATTPAAITAQTTLQSYQLDTVGNRLALQNKSTTQTYLPNDGQKLTNSMNRYETVDGKGFSYDAKGNTLKDERNTYTYDYENRQIGMNGTSGTASYTYNALGQQVAKTVNGKTTFFVHNRRNQTIEVRNGTNVLETRYIFGGYVDEVLTMSNNSHTYSYHRDAQYSIVELSDSAGALSERYEYDIFGTPIFLDNANQTLVTSALSNTILYTGRYYDYSSNNYDFRSRVYSSNLGRFAQQDLLGYVDGMNLYASYFVVSDVDPTGNFTVEDVPNFEMELAGFALYVGGGGEVSVSIKKDYKDCCKQGKRISNGDKKLSIMLNAAAGVGIGGKVKVLGYGMELMWRMQTVKLELRGELSNSECGGNINTFSKCTEQGLALNFVYSGGVGPGQVEIAGGAEGTTELCARYSASGTKIELKYCGKVTGEMNYQLFGVKGQVFGIPEGRGDGCRTLWEGDFDIWID